MYLEDLEDGRNTYLKDNGGEVELIYNKIERWENLFLTPNFIQNFDFNGGYDLQILNSKSSFAAIQVGIYLLNEEE